MAWAAGQLPARVLRASRRAPRKAACAAAFPRDLQMLMQASSSAPQSITHWRIAWQVASVAHRRSPRCATCPPPPSFDPPPLEQANAATTKAAASAAVRPRISDMRHGGAGSVNELMASANLMSGSQTLPLRSARRIAALMRKLWSAPRDARPRRPEHAGPDRRNAARPPAPPGRRVDGRRVLQVRAVQPRRLAQGSHRAVHDRGRRARGPHPTRASR